MTINRLPHLVLSVVITTGGLAAASSAAACAGSGLITRIAGKPQDVIITRTEPGQKPAQVARPRVLETVCAGDVIRAQAPTKVTLSVDGAGVVQVGPAPYTVPARRGAPTLAGNAYRSVSDNVLPDMKRLPWDVRLKGAGTGFEFALPALASGKQVVREGRRDLLVRLAGGSGPYTVTITGTNGQTAGSAKAAESDVLIRGAALTVGSYRIRAADSAGNVVEAAFNVTRQGPPAQPDDAGLPDPETRAAVRALELAKSDPGVWSLEAEQILAQAPEAGLDRARVYQLLESYDSAP